MGRFKDLLQESEKMPESLVEDLKVEDLKIEDVVEKPTQTTKASKRKKIKH